MIGSPKSGPSHCLASGGVECEYSSCKQLTRSFWSNLQSIHCQYHLLHWVFWGYAYQYIFRVINLHMLWNELQISWWKLIHVTVSVPRVQHIFTSWLLTDHQYCKACLRAKRMPLCSTHCFPVFWGLCDRQRPRQLIERSAWSNRISLKSLSHIPWHRKNLLWPLVKWMPY